MFFSFVFCYFILPCFDRFDFCLFIFLDGVRELAFEPGPPGVRDPGAPGLRAPPGFPVLGLLNLVFFSDFLGDFLGVFSVEREKNIYFNALIDHQVSCVI